MIGACWFVFIIIITLSCALLPESSPSLYLCLVNSDTHVCNVLSDLYITLDKSVCKINVNVYVNVVLHSDSRNNSATLMYQS